MKNRNLKNKKAFSLIELSIVILIVGIVVAGVTQSSRLIGAFKLSSARSLTQSSPVASMKNLQSWWEATSLTSFAESESDEAQPITTWYDINPTSTSKYNIGQSTAGYKPTYRINCINSLPCVRFDGSNDYLTTTSADITGNQVTIFVVAKRRAVSVETSVICAYPTGAGADYDNMSALVGFYEGPSGAWLYAVRNVGLSYANHPGNAITYVATAIWDGTNNTVYLNGAAQTPVSSSGNFSSQVIQIGARWGYGGVNSFYNGDVAEIIILSRAIKTEERQAIERYLGKKWGITVS